MDLAEFFATRAEPDARILALLVCGYVVAAFVPRRRDRRGLGRVVVHALRFALVTAVLVLPFARTGLAARALAVLAALHVVVGGVCARFDARREPPLLTWFAVEQLVLVGALLYTWKLGLFEVVDAPSRLLARATAIVAVLVFNANGASAIVQRVLARIAPAGSAGNGDEDEGPAGAGRLIGILERWLILGLVWVDQWGAVGLVLTAKSIARFKRMDEQAFAETYLIGTMTSVLVAMAGGAVLKVLLAGI